jgi:hypothetical protein
MIFLLCARCSLYVSELNPLGEPGRYAVATGFQLVVVNQVEEGQVDKRGEREWGRDIGFVRENKRADLFYERRLVQRQATSEML